jgi:hypothetical protein
MGGRARSASLGLAALGLVAAAAWLLAPWQAAGLEASGGIPAPSTTARASRAPPVRPAPARCPVAAAPEAGAAAAAALPDLPRLDATAVWEGGVVDAYGRGLAATLEILSGPNRGERIDTQSDGRFERADLFPGLALVRCEAPGLRATRIVGLRHGLPTRWDLRMRAPTLVEARVIDSFRAPVRGASVEIEGQTVETDSGGLFQAWSSLEGSTWLTVRAAGLASTAMELPVDGGPAAPIVMQPAASLEVSVGTGGGPVDVYLLPCERRPGRWLPGVARSTEAGSRLVFTDLPAIAFEIRALGARARYAPRRISLRAGTAIDRVELVAEPGVLLRGRVLAGGEPVAGAAVALHLGRALRAARNELDDVLRDAANLSLGLHPAVRQRCTTDLAGRFELGAGPASGGPAHLLVAPPGGTPRAFPVLATSRELVLDLRPR